MIEKISLKTGNDQYLVQIVNNNNHSRQQSVMNQDLPISQVIGDTSMSRHETSREMILQSIKYREIKK